MSIAIPKMTQESTSGRVQSAENRFPRRGLYSSILALFAEIDFRQLSIPSRSQFLNHFRYKWHKVSFSFLASLCLFAENEMSASTLKYGTYLESWNVSWETDLNGLSSYENVTVAIAFADYSFTGNNGVQFTDSNALGIAIKTVQDKGGKVVLSFGGSSNSPNSYQILLTTGWPGNSQPLATSVAGLITASYLDGSGGTYYLDGVDFDIECNLSAGQTIPDTANALALFISQVRTALPNKIVSLTLPGQAWATYGKPLAQNSTLLASVDYINFMEYDLWLAGTDTYAAQIQGDISVYIAPITDSGSAPIWAPGWGIPANKIQVGLMPRCDDSYPPQYLSVSDATTLATFAVNAGLYGVMTWDLDRDAGSNLSPNCSQAPTLVPYAYTEAILNVLSTASPSASFGNKATTYPSNGRCVTLTPFVQQPPPAQGYPH